jgi:hypothetical protein
MQFGAQLMNYFTSWEEILPTIKKVQSGRWNSLWFSDHFLPPTPGQNLEHERALDGWTLITAAAVETKRLRVSLTNRRRMSESMKKFYQLLFECFLS